MIVDGAHQCTVIFVHENEVSSAKTLPSLLIWKKRLPLSAFEICNFGVHVCKVLTPLNVLVKYLVIVFHDSPDQEDLVVNVPRVIPDVRAGVVCLPHEVGPQDNPNVVDVHLGLLALGQQLLEELEHVLDVQDHIGFQLISQELPDQPDSCRPVLGRLQGSLFPLCVAFSQ